MSWYQQWILNSVWISLLTREIHILILPQICTKVTPFYCWPIQWQHFKALALNDNRGSTTFQISGVLFTITQFILLICNWNTHYFKKNWPFSSSPRGQIVVFSKFQGPKTLPLGHLEPSDNHNFKVNVPNDYHSADSNSPDNLTFF